MHAYQKAHTYRYVRVIFIILTEIPAELDTPPILSALPSVAASRMTVTPVMSESSLRLAELLTSITVGDVLSLRVTALSTPIS